MNVKELVNQKLSSQKAVKATETRTKFVVFLSDKTRAKLDGLKASTGEGVIALASEILAAAVDEAIPDKGA